MTQSFLKKAINELTPLSADLMEKDLETSFRIWKLKKKFGLLEDGEVDDEVNAIATKV